MGEQGATRGRVVLADVARAAGVSTALASIVMRGVPGASPTNRERVMAVAKQLGYVPDARARVLRQGRSHLLGVMFGVHEPFHADLVEGIYGAAEEAGYDVVLSAVGHTRPEARAVETLLADRCEALILLGPRSPRRWLVGLGARLPVVLVARGVGRDVADPPLDVVRTADVKGIRLAVDHLVALGHLRIAHVDGGDAPGAEQRRRGYRDAMRSHGLADHVQIVPGGLTDESGARAIGDLLAADALPTGILAFNDRCARGVLDASHRAGVLVPDRLSVVGFDDSSGAGLAHIDLTTVSQDAATMARLAVRRAIDRLDTPADAPAPSLREVIVRPTLVIRGTTAAPPASI